MACLREQTLEGRSGTILCDEEGCQFRRFATRSGYEVISGAWPPDCVLQLRLRAGNAENIREQNMGINGIENLIEEMGPALDESRRRRVEGEPSNLKITAYEIIDGKRVEIPDRRVERPQTPADSGD